ncbi:right-handed parallel beta-helix repeat-containing protein [Phycisphaeraceae bacterium D3-23]
MRLACLCASLCCTLPALAQRTIHVPRDLPTIQQAVDEASTGDTVVVAAGTYNGSIHFHNKHITLISEDGAENTTLTHEGRVVEMGPLGVLAGFTITCPPGGAVKTNGNGSIVEDCIFEGNGVRNSRGTSCLGGMGSPIVRRNIFRYNGGPLAWGSNVLGFSNSSSPRIENNLFHDNTTMCIDLQLPQDTNAVAINNTIVNCGGGIAAGAYVANNIIVGCTVACKRHNNMPKDWVFENNLLYDNDEDYGLDQRFNEGVERNTFRGEPRFVDPEAHDYRLQLLSAGIDLGADRRAPDEDLLGATRPAPIAEGEPLLYDIGAYEYVPEGYTPPESIAAPRPGQRTGHFVLIQARWGRGSVWADVSEPVLDHLDERGLDIHADTRRVETDPAPGKPKTLVLHYRIGTRAYFRVYEQGERGRINFSIPPADAPPGQDIVILEASYGASTFVADRTDWLAEVVAAGQASLTVSPETVFIDPAPGRQKILTVAYLYQGRYLTAAVGDGQTLHLNPSAPGRVTNAEINDPVPSPGPRQTGIDDAHATDRHQNPPPFQSVTENLHTDPQATNPSGLTIERQNPNAPPTPATESKPLVPAATVNTALWVGVGLVVLIITLVAGLLIVILLMDRTSKRGEARDVGEVID